MARSEKFLCKRIRQKERRQPIAADAPPFRQLSHHAGLHQPALVGAHHQLRAVVRIELGHNAREVRLDRCGADEQALADLVVVKAARDQREDLALAVGAPGAPPRTSRCAGA